MPTYTSQYPTAHNDTYVKATSQYTPNYYCYFATDPAKSLIGNGSGTSWLTPSGTITNQRFHIDLGSTKIIRRIYYENYHSSGTKTGRGLENFTFWGSNTEASFLELTYGTDTGWTELTAAQNTFDEHSAADEADPKYIVVTNTTAYQYYALKCVDIWDSEVENYLGFKRVELQTEDGFRVANAIFFGANF